MPLRLPPLWIPGHISGVTVMLPSHGHIHHGWFHKHFFSGLVLLRLDLHFPLINYEADLYTKNTLPSNLYHSMISAKITKCMFHKATCEWGIWRFEWFIHQEVACRSSSSDMLISSVQEELKDWAQDPPCATSADHITGQNGLGDVEEFFDSLFLASGRLVTYQLNYERRSPHQQAHKKGLQGTSVWPSWLEHILLCEDKVPHFKNSVMPSIKPTWTQKLVCFSFPSTSSPCLTSYITDPFWFERTPFGMAVQLGWQWIVSGYSPVWLLVIDMWQRFGVSTNSDQLRMIGQKRL